MLIMVRVTSSHHLTRLTPPPRLSAREQQSPLHLPREERGPHQRGVTSFVSVSGVGKKLRCNKSQGKNLTFHHHPLLSTRLPESAPERPTTLCGQVQDGVSYRGKSVSSNRPSLSLLLSGTQWQVPQWQCLHAHQGKTKRRGATFRSAALFSTQESLIASKQVLGRASGSAPRSPTTTLTCTPAPEAATEAQGWGGGAVSRVHAKPATHYGEVSRGGNRN